MTVNTGDRIRATWIRLSAVVSLLCLAILVFFFGSSLVLRRHAMSQRYELVAGLVARTIAVDPSLSWIGRFRKRLAPSGPVFRSALNFEAWTVGPDLQVTAATTPEAAPVRSSDLTNLETLDPFSGRTVQETIRHVVEVVPLPGPEPRFLIMRFDRFHSIEALLVSGLFLFGAALVVGSVVFSVLLVFLYFRTRAREAVRVFALLARGDLGARFRISRLDETGRLMDVFNRMAAEIETLVQQLRESEQARKKFLQEIGHDIRTPLTAILATADALKHGRTRLTEEQVAVCLNTLSSEADYLNHLIEDLFFIAEMEEPADQRGPKETVDLAELVRNEVERRLVTTDGKGKHLAWKLEVYEPSTYLVEGNTRLLLRMVRNALDNAAKFASGNVLVSLASDPAGNLSLAIQDDGPGVSAEDARAFGVRRNERLPAGSFRSGLSLGLGSVIIRQVAERHGGSVVISSLPGPSLSSGAILTITLPRREEGAKAAA